MAITKEFFREIDTRDLSVKVLEELVDSCFWDGEDESAVEYSYELLTEYQHLEELYPGRYEESIVKVSGNYSSALVYLNDFKKAEKEFERCLDILRKLPNDNPEYQYAIAEALFYFAELYFNENDNSNSAVNCSEARKILEGLSEQNPDVEKYAALLEEAKRHSQYIAYSRMYDAAMNA